MKRKILLFAACAFAICSRAVVTFPLDYNNFFAASAINSNGTQLETGNANAVGTWTVGAAGSASNPTVATNNLSYSTYVDNNSGKKISLPSLASGTARTSFFYITSSAADLTANTYYLGFLINTSATPSSGVIFLNLGDGTPGTQRGRILIKQNTGNTGYLIQASVDGSPTATTNSISYNSTHFIALKYQITTAGASGAAASMTLFVDPTIGSSEPSSTFTISDTGISSLSCIKSLTVTQQIGLVTEIAGLRMGSTWADVCKAAAAPKLTTPTISVANPVTASGFTANWSPVTNAISYDVKVYQNASLVSTTNVSGQSSSSMDIPGLSNFLTYTYSVTAKGDGSNYADSDPSTVKTFTTLDPNAVTSINTDFADGSWTALTAGPSSYSDVSTNGFDFVQSNLSSGAYYGGKGELHSKVIGVANKTAGGKITFPTVNSVAQIEIHAATGTAERTFDLKEYNKVTGSYDLIATYTYNTASKNSGLDSIYIIPLVRSTPSKFRIENSGFGSISVMQVKVLATAPSLLSKATVGAASVVKANTCTANWIPVANASGYTVKVYLQKHNGAGAITSTSLKFTGSALGASASSVAVTGLQSDSTYNYSVQALGDGDVVYSDSYLSGFSANFTTGHQLAIPATSTPWASNATNLVATWSVVANAMGYEVKLYEGATSGAETYLKTVSVSDGLASSAPISGATFGNYYTFTVKALGDNSTYYDSYTSAQSTEYFHDLTTKLINNKHTNSVLVSGKTLNFEQVMSVDLFNAQGTLLLHAANVAKIDTGLQSGMYVVRFTDASGASIAKRILIK